jgi:putative heme-binding domain-containing protein
VIYDGAALPAAYNGRLLGVAPLLSHVVMSEVQSDRSSFKTKDLGHVLESSDTWFRPVDIQVGPDGAVYVADFYEQRIDHASHYQGRVDKGTGRIYRLRAKGDASATPRFDLAKESTLELLDQLTHANKWFRQTAQRELLLRQDASVMRELFARVRIVSGQPALEYLWTIYKLAELTDKQALALLDHADPHVRLWTVRLECDDGQITSLLAEKLIDMARREPHVEVRSQLAASARRLPAPQALPVLKELASRSEDVEDIHVPLLIWWGIEAKAEKDRELVLGLFGDSSFWDQKLVGKHLVERLMRRYASSGKRQDLLACARLLALAPNKDQAAKLMAGLEAAYEGRPLANLPDELATAMAKAGANSPTLRLRQGEAQAVDDALATIADEAADVTKRQQLIGIFGTIRQPRCVPALLKIVQESRNDGLRSAALAALQSYDNPVVSGTVVGLYSGMPEQVREVAQSVLASRKPWAEAFLAAIDAGKIDPQTISEPTVRKLLLHGSGQITELCRKHWGELSGPSADELREQVEKLSGVISAASGNPYQGKQLYMASCGKCHLLFTQGGKIGPDLTAYKRDDLRGILLNVVNPSAEIREGFENYIAQTADGRVLTGFIADQDANTVVLRGADGQNVIVPRDELEELRATRQSVMPDGLLKNFTDQQIRDLFAYLRARQPLP